MARVSDITANLDFAHEQNGELLQLIGEAQKNNAQVKHISQKAGAILGAIRECYDYAIVDIRDSFLPNIKGSVYFPFHPDTLKQGKPLHGLKTAAPQVYMHLQKLTGLMHGQKVVPGTICRFSDARAVNELVNAKKHDKILVVEEVGNIKTRIEMPDGSTTTVTQMYPMGADGSVDWTNPHGGTGPNAWTTSPGVKVVSVKDFHFNPGKIKISRLDVHGFGMIAITATRFIIGEVYEVAFGHSANQFLER